MNAAAATVSQKWRVATTASKSVVWRTPPALFLALDKEFDFTIDVAADDGNAHVDRYFDAEQDGLAQPWGAERIFCNPPYGRDLKLWVAKAVLESQEKGALVVLLLPARTGNSWFHQYCLPHAEVRFIRGRLNFSKHRVGSKRYRAPFDSMVVVFHPFRIGEGHIRTQPTFPGFER